MDKNCPEDDNTFALSMGKNCPEDDDTVAWSVFCCQWVRTVQRTITLLPCQWVGAVQRTMTLLPGQCSVALSVGWSRTEDDDTVAWSVFCCLVSG